MSPLTAFTKMHGAGNDFIMFDGRDLEATPLDSRRIADLCDRRTGVGGDGLIIIGPGRSPGSSFRMNYFNADGGEAAMCGNGARCSVEFAHGLGLASGTCSFDTGAGLIEGIRHGPGDIEVTLAPWKDLELDLELGETPWPAHHLCHTGVPHLVIPVEDIEAVEVEQWGPRLRNHPRLAPGGANINWVAPGRGPGTFRMRTYERGVEAETLACGTGASAVSVVLCRLGLATSPVAVQTRGGDMLTVKVDLDRGVLGLRGPAVTSFQGEVWIDD